MTYNIAEVIGSEDCQLVAHYATAGTVVVFLIECARGTLQRRVYELHTGEHVRNNSFGEHVQHVREWVLCC